ncbi:hypothetical protein Lal_00032910 [Lupinus albus]|nr:hypothetical protein Lal_00032910 [Lupinus albus]
MEGYKRWVREKKEYVHSFETLSTGLMWVPPELFSNSEIVPEAGFVKFWFRIAIVIMIAVTVTAAVEFEVVRCDLMQPKCSPIWFHCNCGVWNNFYLSSFLAATCIVVTYKNLCFHAVTTILGIITTINAHIIETAPTQDITGSTESYSFPYSLFLSVLAGLESLVEGVAQHYYGDNKKWNFLVVTEATKPLGPDTVELRSHYCDSLSLNCNVAAASYEAVHNLNHWVLVRLSLFRKSGYKMLLSGMETSNDDTNSISLTSQDQSSLIRFGEMEPMTSNRVDQNHQREIAAECTMLSTCRVDQNHHQEAIIDPPGNIFSDRETNTIRHIVEKGKYSIRSWTPWFLSLAFDCIGMSILSLVATSVAGRKERRIYLSASEKDETATEEPPTTGEFHCYRGMGRVKSYKQKLESIEKVLEPVPVIGFLTAKAVELIIGCQTRYTYISGS